MKDIIAISLFSGAGGCSLGFKNAGYNIVYANDINDKAVSTYKYNFPNTECSNLDIRDINFSHLLKSLQLSPGEIDIVIGGPPCQGFSSAGSRFWEDPRNELLKNYVHALQVMKPKWFLMENVEGLLTANRGRYLYEVAKAFMGLGYSIRIDKIYSQEYGIPQRRKRVFIVGNLFDLDLSLPEPITELGGSIFRKSDITLGNTISGLPQPTNNSEKPVAFDNPPDSIWEEELRDGCSSVYDHFVPNMNELQLQRIRALQPGQTMKDLPEQLQHSSFRKRARRRVKDGTPSDKRGGAPSGLKRLFWDEPSLTITSAATREFIHPREDRTLTIRECARLQTFPDSFRFLGSNTDKVKQIGNAIPPILACIFALHIRDRFGFPSHSTIQSNLGHLSGFSLTKANAMSPALQRTNQLLHSLGSKPTSNLF